MACQVLRACSVMLHPLKHVQVSKTGLTKCSEILTRDRFLQPHNLVFLCHRNTSFFNKISADQLWKGVTSVSNAGKKRGRGRGRKPIRNLNRGQVIGVGKVNMVWPGLTTSVVRGRELVVQHKLPENPERDQKLNSLRDSLSVRKVQKLSPLERGWSGYHLGGRSIGPPEPVGEDKFEGFDTRILEFKVVCNMSGIFGRRRRTSAFVVTGNSNGVVGLSLAKSPDPKGALRTSKARAAQRLMYINLYNNHTVMHDFYAQFGKTKVYVAKKPQGYGLVCHRAIKSCCDVIGIKDLYAKVEGNRNLQHLVKAFFIGLLQQKSYNQLAEEKKLHLVEIRKENCYYPNVLASPKEVRELKDVKVDEVRDFRQYVMDGKIRLQKKKLPPFYTSQNSWLIYKKKQEYLRNQHQVKIRLLAEHGELRSFLTDQYPEAKSAPYDRPQKKEL
ncbi:28S ribosomal protein S5, mitochondrial [Orussus abietinus]|uniref:28S ribosomal protein S5, mitochondrial n=1 Tax=Orussus abietinus TaxID=222816 RepID=UPI000625AA9A|nr:28S ribosomal protein S5, mitochondrial [Orussus abietinus]